MVALVIVVKKISGFLADIGVESKIAMDPSPDFSTSNDSFIFLAIKFRNSEKSIILAKRGLQLDLVLSSHVLIEWVSDLTEAAGARSCENDLVLFVGDVDSDQTMERLGCGGGLVGLRSR
ncbi:hypothetical protein ACFX13_011258 [Malus domestica]